MDDKNLSYLLTRVHRQRWYDMRRERQRFRYARNVARVYYLRQTVLARERKRNKQFLWGEDKNWNLSRGCPFSYVPAPLFELPANIDRRGRCTSTLRYAKFIFRDPPGEAFWNFTTGSNWVEQKCQSRLRQVKRAFVVSYRVDTLKGAAISRVCRHAFRFVSIRLPIALYSVHHRIDQEDSNCFV